METPLPKSHAHLPPLAADSLLAVGLTLFVWLNMSTPVLLVRSGLRMPMRGFGPFEFRVLTPTPLAFLIVAACFLPLALRRRYTIPVLAATTIAAAAFELFRHPPALTVLGPLVAVYTVGTLYDRVTTAAAAIGSAAVLLTTSLPPIADTRWLAELVRVLAMVAVAASVGVAARTQRAYVAEAERRAEEAEARGEEEARRRVDEERLRIARELHDVTAHSLSVIAVQSGAAAHVLDSDPEAARTALAEIKKTSRQALGELRAVVGSLRAEGDADSDAPLAPSPGVAHVSDLVRPLEQAGFRVELAVGGDLSLLPPLADASGYRIVQEALTNVMRHAGPEAAVAVSVRVGEDLLALEVTDNGTGAHDTVAEGHGIAGMRERALALGGTFEAGPLPGGGWRVTTTLPLAARRLS